MNTLGNKLDTGFECLQLVAQFHGQPVDPAKLRHEFGDGFFNQQTILLAAKTVGLHGRAVRRRIDQLDNAPLPAIAADKEGNFFILARVEKTEGRRRFLIQRIGATPEILDETGLRRIWADELIYIASRRSLVGELAHFDFSWFIPAIVKYRRLIIEVVFISVIIQLIGLASPIFFQIVMDKVLVNHATTTLNVIAVGLVLATLFEAVLKGTRSYVFAHMSSKIDVELGAKLFQHLLSLPLTYFHTRRVGDSVARVRELENIRSFLTGNAITVLLDVCFSGIVFAVMLWYSPTLTVVVAASVPVYIAISFFLTPLLRAKLQEKFNRSAESQAFLVETITAVDTVKALAVEPRWINQWGHLLASYVVAGLAAGNVGNFASGCVQLVSKAVTILLMWIGASLVLKDALSVGQLIAFNMLAGQVATPILRLAQLWNDFQQVGISMKRLGDILNVPGERSHSGTAITEIAGKIEFQRVRFRYQPDAQEVLKEISFDIKPGQVIGIVGRSGSGKSTLSKLIQRLYVPGHGRVLIDGNDISAIDPASLRHRVGVVLQENMLFARSIRDNIAVQNSGANLEHIIHCAKMAGAHEFICELPDGYDTLVGEHGVGLSGGQRQRIAIARALLNDPRILIFDEATSALDYESENIIQNNMSQICQDRTVLIIAHRLSAVRHADQILVLDKGEVVEQGKHADLVRRGGIYAKLSALQAGAQISEVAAVCA
jgi:subfamily B ATP-binding cassette protein HlyB/CyaB